MRIKLILLMLLFIVAGEAQEKPSTLSLKELQEVNDVSDYYVSKSSMTPLAKLLYKAYLANAQRDFAWKAQEEQGGFYGSFVPVTLGIWELFQPKILLDELESRPIEASSANLSAKIVTFYRDRLMSEGAQIKNSQFPTHPGFWSPEEEPAYGVNFASLKPWSLKNCSEYRCAKPTETVKSELEKVKSYVVNVDIKQLAMIDYWSNQADWVKLADAYMDKKGTPLEIRLNVHAALQSGIVDATGAAFDSKYWFVIPRPSSVDPDIFPTVPLPNHPSYPSSRSTVSRTVAVILTGFFPENKAEWDHFAEESGVSSIAAGIHFPMDHLAGKKLGESVGKATLLKYKP